VREYFKIVVGGKQMFIKEILKMKFLILIMPIIWLNLFQIYMVSAENNYPSEKYAWSETTGWLDFYANKEHSVQVLDNYMIGYIWAENIGWIRLSVNTDGPFENSHTDNWGVNIDRNNILSGFAWSENVGWISFASDIHQVMLDPFTETFSGYAWGENIGYIRLSNTEKGYAVTMRGLDHTKPIVLGLDNDLNLKQSKTWQWTADEICTFRFAINQDESWEPVGSFSSIMSTTKEEVNGKWYLHVQARDKADNLSDVISVYAILESAIQLIPDTERQELIDLYNSTNGDNWANHSNWLGEPGTECNWFGIECNEEKTHVVKIVLEENNLSGEVSPSIENLTHLTALYLNSNNLTGLPPEIGNLSNLNEISLCNNGLTSIPSEIGNLSNLWLLALSGNDLTNLPVKIADLASLSLLDLASNKLKELPEEIGLHNIIEIYLSGNQLQSLPKTITNLDLIDLGFSYFDYNALEINDTSITSFLDLYYINWRDWRDTQTVSPKNISITNCTTNSFSLSWSAIKYVDHQGGYEVFVSESSNNSYTRFGITENKTTEQFTITGLSPNTTYYCKVRSVTFRPLSNNSTDPINKEHTVYSRFSDVISAKTLPLEAFIETHQHYIFSDDASTIPITITINTDMNIVEQDITISAQNGTVVVNSIHNLPEQIFCLLQPDLDADKEIISIAYKGNIIASKQIGILEKNQNYLSLRPNHIVQDINQSSEDIMLIVYGEWRNLFPEITLQLSSTAEQNGAFLIDGSQWVWGSTSQMLSSETDTLMFNYKSPTTGIYTLTVSESPDAGIQDAQMTIEVVGLPVASVSPALSGYVQSSIIQLDVTGSCITSYQYKLNQDNWSNEYNINTPIVFNNLEDNSYTLCVIGKNKAGTWQDEASVYHWIIDRHAKPPVLKLPSEFDTGALNNDHITRLTEITIVGSCENGATIEFFDHNTPITYEHIDFSTNTFSAIFIFEHGDHQMTARQTDKAGNLSQISLILPFTIDASLTNFSVELSDLMNKDICTWVLSPETVSFSGTKEKDASISLSNTHASDVHVSYPDDQHWKVELVNMETGQYTILINARDIAGNTSTIEKTIYRLRPDNIHIDSTSKQLLADGNTALPLTISFFSEEHIALCLNPEVTLITNMGHLINVSHSIDKISADLISGRDLGTATISVLFDDNIIGSTNFEMIAGPVDQLTLLYLESMQEINTTGSFITVQTQDAYGHPVAVTDDIEIMLSSSAGNDGEFYLKQEGWNWYAGPVTQRFPSGSSEFMFKFKSSVTGDMRIIVQENALQSIESASLTMTIVGKAIAELINPPPSFTNQTNFQLWVQGNFVETYQYSLDQMTWSSEKSIHEPIKLTHLTDGPHAIYIIGKNAMGNWQEKPFSTSTFWTVDTIIQPPANLYVPSEYDTGIRDNDRITQYNSLNIRGSCEPNATIALFCNDSPFTDAEIIVDENEFTAGVVLSNTINIISAIQTDLASNTSKLSDPITITIDKTPPEVTGLSDESAPVISQTWIWNASENDCIFRFAIDQNESWIPSGEFAPYNRAEKSKTLGKWFIHVQVKDAAGNLSNPVTASVEFMPPSIQFQHPYSEGFEDNTTVEIELTLSHVIDQDVDFSYNRTYDIPLQYDYAAYGFDFELPDAPYATIQAGDLTTTIQLSIINDHIFELKEGMHMQLLSVNDPFRIGIQDVHTFIIKDNDKPGISISQSSEKPVISEGGEQHRLTVVLDSEPEYDVTIQLDSAQDRLHITPTTLSFQANEWNLAREVFISAPDDHIYKGSCDIYIAFQVISIDSYYHAMNPKTFFYIQDDEPQPLSPVISGPDSPYNSKSVQWCWESGGGSHLYRYKIDDSNLHEGAMETTSLCYRHHSDLTEGEHTFYIQEYNEHTSKWSDAASYDVDIDTGHPCSTAFSPPSATAQLNMVEISYTYDDIYLNQMCGDSATGSGLKKIELWVAKPGEMTYRLADTDEKDAIDGAFEYEMTIEGRYRFLSRAIDRANNAEFSPIPDPDKFYDSETIYARQFSGYAILAVGNVTDQEGLDSHTLTADSIYTQLINRHFGVYHNMQDSLDHIKYFNPNRANHTGVDPFDKDSLDRPLSYKESLKRAIEVWALDRMSTIPGPLYIILIDHGAPDIFYLSDNSETLNPYELNDWITNLEISIQESGIESNEIVIILGSCYSGSFIPKLSGPYRIVIASSAHDEASYRGPEEPGGVREGAFFVSNLFNELAKEKSLAESFMISVQRTEELTHQNLTNRLAPYFDTAAQHPLLDDDGDGKGSNHIQFTKDGRQSENIYLGVASSSDDLVYFKEVECTPQRLSSQENTVSFKASVNKVDKVNAMWLEIRKPDIRLPDLLYKFRQKELDLEEVYLTDNQSLNQYVLNYDQFIEAGKYSIYFYVKNNEGIISGFDETIIYKNKENNSPPEPVHLISPINLDDPEHIHSNETEFTDVILQWEDSRDPDHDQFTYTAYLSKNSTFDDSVTIVKEQILETICLVNLPHSWDKSNVYWKVFAIDDYGAQSESEVFRFYIENLEDALPIVFVHVYDSRSNRPIPKALVRFESKDSRIEMTMNHQGHFIERIQPGAYDISINGDHYVFKPENVVIDTQSEISLSFGLTSTIQTGDINRNGKQDIGDAIQCLQIISGIEDAYYYDQGALTGNVLELRDAIFIMQRLSEIVYNIKK
jgi:Leucine-rich repeat (LRR) protein